MEFIDTMILALATHEQGVQLPQATPGFREVYPNSPLTTSHRVSRVTGSATAPRPTFTSTGATLTERTARKARRKLVV